MLLWFLVARVRKPFKNSVLLLFFSVIICYYACMNTETSLPEKIGKPAMRALLGAGITTLQQATRISDEDLLKLHGVGPKAVRILRESARP